MPRRDSPYVAIVILLASLSVPILGSQSGGRQVRNHRKQDSTTKSAPGYYFTLGTCHACAYFGWHEEAIRLFRTRGIPAFKGSGFENLSSSAPFAPMGAFQMLNPESAFWAMALYVGPFDSESAATQGLLQFPAVLLRIMETRGGFDDEVRANQSASVTRRSGNRYDFGNSSFFMIGGYQLATGKQETAADGFEDFYRQFRTVVASRDRAALKDTMSSKFEWAMDGFVSRDQALKYIAEIIGWQKFWQSARTAVARKPTLCKPPYCNYRSGYHAWAKSPFPVELLFERGSDGKWRWTGIIGE